jgi:O-succinylbenzoic acid--CoA ligase
LNTRLTARELAHPLHDCGANVLLHGDDELADTAESACNEVDGIRPIRVSSNGSLRPNALAPSARKRSRRSIQGLAVLYTSGTTGVPKGAVLTHENFHASAVGSALHLGVLPTDRWLACMPLFHVGGLSILVRSVLYGTAALIHERFDEEAVNHSLDTENVTLVSLAPALLERVLDARGDRPAPAELRCVLLGGGPAPAALLERARDLGFPIAPTYGLTEATSQVATRLPDDTGPFGAGVPPLFGTELRIATPDASEDTTDPFENRIDAPGEILVRARTVMTGYLNRPRETEEALLCGWLHTGDIGTLDERGWLRVLDRRSDLIVSGGENVYPAEVERALCEHPAVVEAGVAAVPDAAFGSRPAAWIVVRGPAPSDAALEAFCRERLAGYKVPVSYRTVEALPRNAAGKLLRRRLV